MERSLWSVHETFDIPCRAFPSSMYDLGSSLAGTAVGYVWAHFHWSGVIAFIAVLLALSYPLHPL
ncbi:hypothetical protein [Geobacillus thermoleovorans]|uniref:hypothetical protein n=1 Tax=Geobacillus thermoleovorans TaxID=33941 RepID=UPI003F587D6B